ncbi:MAG: hypothetical protein ABW185_12975 [Sedimenticola sp.]
MRKPLGVAPIQSRRRLTGLRFTCRRILGANAADLFAPLVGKAHSHNGGKAGHAPENVERLVVVYVPQGLSKAR